MFRPSNPNRHSQRHKMAVLTFLGLLVPVYVIPDALDYFLPEQRILGTLLGVALIVILMTYVIMPVLIRGFRGWIDS